MKEPLISVIVPVYQVEPWLERCVLSIRRQTYRNLEIILVDDGSPDRCGEMCDMFAREDDRITVVHQENGGLSAARNAGLDVCHGAYIGFVDSDDAIHPEMYSRLLDDIRTFGTSLAFCQTFLCSDEGPAISFPQVDDLAECLSRDEIIRSALRENGWFSANTKLYQRSLFDGLRYPEGRINEDFPVTIRIYDRCDRIVVDHNPMYAYCKRAGSITTAPFSERSFDQIINAEDVHAYIRETHPDYLNLSARILLSSCLGLLLKTDGALANQFKAKREELFAMIRKYFPKEKRNPYLSLPQKLLLSAAHSGGLIYAIASWIYRAIKRTM